jgi:hypothetical protein
MVILMALTKVSGVMMCEAKGIAPELRNLDTAIRWFSDGAAAAYMAHEEIMGEPDGTVH